MSWSDKLPQVHQLHPHQEEITLVHRATNQPLRDNPKARFSSGGNKKINKKTRRLSPPQSKLFFIKGRFIGASEFQFSLAAPPPTPHLSYFQKVIGEEGKQRPPKTYGKLRTWGSANRLPPPPAHELLVVNE